MRTYVCVRRKHGRPDGERFTVFVTVSAPRYAKRGHSFVTVFREDDQGRKTCLFPAQEVPGDGDHAARTFLTERLGWFVNSDTLPKRAKRGCAVSNPHRALHEEHTQPLDLSDETASRARP